ncbi:bacterial hemoglobin protein [Apiospora rasikravindrae]|uniref:Bacterial hemoglobin protein n=1 Tax=Apiospora rasikravindrae TaxID=990691 RepID=A0ABR1T0D3_9PEZI
MEVVAVSRSMPKELDLGGMKISSSMIHEPLTSPADYIEIDEHGVVGNQPAVHDGPVYLFFAEHYDHWCAELGVDRSTWDWCHWAENITVRYKKGKGGADDAKPRFETEMHLGEVWRIGPDVRLELCGSRIPCMKVSWRCGQKDSWLRPLAESGRVGVYMRVLQGGRVHPGDDIVVESVPSSCSATDEEQEPSVGMISRIAFDASLKTSDTLDLLANHKLLLPMNKKFLSAKKVGIEDKLNTGKNAWKGWRDLRVAKVVQELGDVKSFYLESVDGAPLANYLPGQFLSVRVPASSAAITTAASAPKRDRVVRSWTISDFVTRDGPTYYRLTIKRGHTPSSEPTGNASTWMHEHAAPGAVLAARSPAGRFVLDWSPPVAMRPVYVSAGIGITPVAAMLGAHARHPKFARTPALWVHVTRSAGDLALWREAARALPEAVALERHVFLTGGLDGDGEGGGNERGLGLGLGLGGLTVNDDDDGAKGKCTVHRGRPDRETLQAILGSSCRWNVLGAGELDVPAKMSPFYVCGPAAFEATVKECLAEAGIPAANIRSESFTAAGTLSGNSGDLETAKVRFAKSGKTATWSRETPVSLLELAESLGLAPDYGCRVGACGSCAAKLTCGAVSGAGVQPDGTVLTCSATPAADVVELDI